LVALAANIGDGQPLEIARRCGGLQFDLEPALPLILAKPALLGRGDPAVEKARGDRDGLFGRTAGSLAKAHVIFARARVAAFAASQRIGRNDPEIQTPLRHAVGHPGVGAGARVGDHASLFRVLVADGGIVDFLVAAGAARQEAIDVLCRISDRDRIRQIVRQKGLDDHPVHAGGRPFVDDVERAGILDEEPLVGAAVREVAVVDAGFLVEAVPVGIRQRHRVRHAPQMRIGFRRGGIALRRRRTDFDDRAEVVRVQVIARQAHVLDARALSPSCRARSDSCRCPGHSGCSTC